MSLARLVFTALIWPSAFVVAALAALAALLAQLGRRSPGFDLLTHFAPFYLAAGLGAALLGLLFHDRYRLLVVGAGLFATLAAGLLIVPEYLRPMGPRAGAPPGPTMKLIQLNVWGGEGGVARAAGWLAAQSPDVVVLEEGNRRVRDAIVERTGWHVVEGRNDVMIFSRQATLARFVPATDAEGPMNLVAITLPTPVGPATIVGVHYPWPTRDSLAQSTAALRVILRRLPSATTILAGDFNSTDWSFARRREDHDFGLIRRTRAMFTWPTQVHAPIPVLPIDHVYAGAAWATVEVRRGPNIGSDHYPVIITLAAAPH